MGTQKCSSHQLLPCMTHLSLMCCTSKWRQPTVSKCCAQGNVEKEGAQRHQEGLAWNIPPTHPSLTQQGRMSPLHVQSHGTSHSDAKVKWNVLFFIRHCFPLSSDVLLQKDPFTRAHLTPEMLKPHTELKKQIDAFLQEQKHKMQQHKTAEN